MMTVAEPAVETTHDTHDQPPTKKGTVKWFNDPKGFGFILDDDGRDVFVHYQTIEGDGFKTLEEGEAVLYDDEDGPKGRRAVRVVRSDTDSNRLGRSHRS